MIRKPITAAMCLSAFPSARSHAAETASSSRPQTPAARQRTKRLSKVARDGNTLSVWIPDHRRVHGNTLLS